MTMIHSIQKALMLLCLLALATCVALAPAKDEAKSAQSGRDALDHIKLTLDNRVLHPVRDKNDMATLTLTAFYSDGFQRVLSSSEAVITAKTKRASGNVDVIAVEGSRVIPKEGGIATVKAAVEQAGRRFTASTDVVVSPFYRDYHQTLVLKLFLGVEGKPVDPLAKDPLFRKPHDVLCTFEEALEVIRKADNLTRGIPKIIYLVGWQKGGHDHGYPAWDEVNPKMKRAQDATALDSLRWLIREARQYNTTVSLHINMVDAYEQSPLWDEYVAKDCIARDENGELLPPNIQMKGDPMYKPMYNVVYPKEWETGLAQRRIDRLIQMIPELREGHTIHIDVFIAQREDGKPISPWHAKPENGGLTPDRYVETQRKIFHYWRDRGFDVTGEGIFWAHPPGEGFTGLQAMSWWYPADTTYQMDIPECLMARGRTHRNGEGDFRFGSSMHGEEIWIQDKDTMPGFLGMFCRTTLPWYYLSRLERVKFENDALYYSDGVVARTEAGKKIIRRGDFILREDDNLFVPALWREKEIIAYSKLGYTDKTSHLPEDWHDVKSVDLYRITLDGCVPLKENVPVTETKLLLSLGKDEAVCIVPTGFPYSGKISDQQIYYLMTSHGEPDTTGLRLALSAGGYHWTALNQDHSVLAPQAGVGNVFRDPSIARDAEGTFHIVWTIGWNTQSNKGIGYVRSKNLIHFEPQRLIPVMENEPKTINVWAPELFWDEVQEQWMILWASTVEGRFPETLSVFDGRMNSRIYYVTTKDFQRFQPSKLVFGPREMMGIDAFILHPAPGQYYLFFKGDRADAPKRGLFVATATRAEGPYTLNPKLLSAESQGWIEGPAAIKIKDEYLLYFGIGDSCGAYRSKNLSRWEDCTSEMVPLPGYRHGTVIEIPGALALRLIEHYGASSQGQDRKLGSR